MLVSAVLRFEFFIFTNNLVKIPAHALIDRRA